MSYEIEQKFRVAGHLEVIAQLKSLGARAEAEIEQVDLYLHHPARDFAKTGEALRIRRVGEQNAITYKGPKHEGPTKTREEIEILFSDGGDHFEQLQALFARLGFEPVAEIRKVRTPYHVSSSRNPIEVVLDVAEGLGTFVEVEAIVDFSEQLPDAQTAVMEFAQSIGLTELEPRSYLRMQLEKQGAIAPK